MIGVQSARHTESPALEWNERSLYEAVVQHGHNGCLPTGSALALASCVSQSPSGGGGLQSGNAPGSVRERISFNTDWRFTKDDPNGTADKLSYKNIRNWVMATGAERSRMTPIWRP